MALRAKVSLTKGGDELQTETTTTTTRRTVSKTTVVKVSKWDRIKAVLYIVLAVVFALYSAFNLFMTFKVEKNQNVQQSFFGYSANLMPVDIMAGTKEDSIRTGTMMIIQQKSLSEVKDGEIVVYHQDGEMYVGRIVEESQSVPGEYIVQADNAQSPYVTLLNEDNFTGTVATTVDWLGDIAMFALTPVGRVITFYLPIVVIILSIISLIVEIIKTARAAKKKIVEKETVEEEVTTVTTVSDNDTKVEAVEEPVVEEPAVEEPVAEEQVAAPAVIAPVIVSTDADDEEDAVATVIVSDDGTQQIVYMRYRKSYMARLIQSDDELKECYEFVKNELLSYKKVKSRVSWNNESFNAGRIKCAKLAIRGKVLWLYLNLDPAEYKESKYFFTDFSEKSKYNDVPLGMKLRSDRSMKHAGELIADMMQKLGLERFDREKEKYELPYEENEALVERDLIKVYYSGKITENSTVVDANINEMITDLEENKDALPKFETVEKISVSEADALLTDEDAEKLIEEEPEAPVVEEPVTEPVAEVEAEEAETSEAEEVTESSPEVKEEAAPAVKKADFKPIAKKSNAKMRRGIVNIDVLDSTFDAGEEINIEEMKRRISGFDKRMTHVKVLARGTVTKPLYIHADEYSIQAVKMILLTGGKAYRTKSSKGGKSR